MYVDVNFWGSEILSLDVVIFVKNFRVLFKGTYDRFVNLYYKRR